ncbi:MAG TPA: hypothetical protein VFC61_03395 [Blastocatellia bacterium]|nr:hypothetical protein [Blastocatellia bacterium]
MPEDRDAGKPHLTKWVAAATIGEGLPMLEYMLTPDEVTHRFVKRRTRPWSSTKPVATS